MGKINFLIYGRVRTSARTFCHVTIPLRSNKKGGPEVIASQREKSFSQSFKQEIMEEGGTDAAIRKNLLDRLLNAVKQVLERDNEKGVGCLLTQQITLLYYTMW